MTRDKPLAGTRVIVLRSVQQAMDFVKKLEALGAEVIQCPLIELVPISSALDQIDRNFLDPFTAVIFTSANGVRFFVEALIKNCGNINALASKKKIAIGPKTAETLQEYGLSVDGIPKKYISEELLQLFQDFASEEKILIPTAEDARTVLHETLKKRGFPVTVLKIYKNIQPSVQKFSLLEKDCVVFTSSSTVDRFFTSSFYTGQKILPFCIGEITKQTLLKYLPDENIYLSKESTMQSMLECIVSLSQ
jgi:uroporphyrinogen III methyltransferase/synthase